jgi:hypothetical protein
MTLYRKGIIPKTAVMQPFNSARLHFPTFLESDTVGMFALDFRPGAPLLWYRWAAGD